MPAADAVLGHALPRAHHRPAPPRSSGSCRRAPSRSARPGRTSGRARTASPARRPRRRRRRSARLCTSRCAFATSALRRARGACRSSSLKLMLNCPTCRIRTPMSLRSGAWATNAAASLLVSDDRLEQALAFAVAELAERRLHAVHEEALDPGEDWSLSPAGGLARVADDEPHRVDHDDAHLAEDARRAPARPSAGSSMSPMGPPKGTLRTGAVFTK